MSTDSHGLIRSALSLMGQMGAWNCELHKLSLKSVFSGYFIIQIHIQSRLKWEEIHSFLSLRLAHRAKQKELSWKCEKSCRLPLSTY